MTILFCSAYLVCVGLAYGWTVYAIDEANYGTGLPPLFRIIAFLLALYGPLIVAAYIWDAYDNNVSLGWKL